MHSSHILWKWKRGVCTDFRGRRGEAMEKKKNSFGIIIAETRGPCVITII
jgi:hypothetical protein